jgi:hypothetical protein
VVRRHSGAHPILTPAATFTSRSLEPKLSNLRALSHYSGIFCPQVVVSLGFSPIFRQADDSKRPGGGVPSNRFFRRSPALHRLAPRNIQSVRSIILWETCLRPRSC